ncbi:MAG: DUF1015 family protein [Gemmatimonadetes bacterium]|nr:DUF1015 family protein [Gemmatimonadota bacterium]
MITITPVRRALIPVDSAAAALVSAPNYDEFQGDREIWDLLQKNPMSVLRVTMAHCQADSPATIGVRDSQDALAKASTNMEELEASELTVEVRDILWVYEIEDPGRPHVRQIGLGGMARTDEIRTDATPEGTIIRNEGVREPKARGRADLIQATSAIIGMVNNGVDDASGEFQKQLEAHASGAPPDLEVLDQHGNRHRVWIVRDEETIHRLQALLAEEPHAYVADGNHRSAAAAMLGYEHFLSVFFSARTMGIRPYNRLVRTPALPADQLAAAIRERFALDTPAGAPTRTSTSPPRLMRSDSTPATGGGSVCAPYRARSIRRTRPRRSTTVSSRRISSSTSSGSPTPVTTGSPSSAATKTRPGCKGRWTKGVRRMR